ncbi:SPOR domain-containing protein [Pseudoxanthomonas sp. UTMC 1351]|uniref:SPOR domain-containing protein n=1 Tax=Pseudoxanthomonas sp. UTMC 1351 TaxID=2695853 RepID=UPI0034CDA869
MDTALKQRLIGAVVLVALAVIFLPMLIKGPAPDSGVSDVPLDVPQAPDGQYETRELPLVAPGNVPNSGAVGLKGAAPANADSARANPATDSAPATGGEMLPATDAAGDFAVSFGAYASTADADAVIARLKQAQLPSYQEPATINGKTAYRVRIGPYADRAAAESARLRAVQVRNDVKAEVVVLNATAAPAAASTASVPAPAAATPAVTTQALPPEPAKPATSTTAAKPAETKPAAKPAASTATATASTPAASNVGFAVQLGAFANAADANALRDKVRAGGFSAFVEQVRTDKGALNRVRVGPVASRADAEKLKSQVAAKFGINGMVRPHP